MRTQVYNTIRGTFKLTSRFAKGLEGRVANCSVRCGSLKNHISRQNAVITMSSARFSKKMLHFISPLLNMLSCIENRHVKQVLQEKAIRLLATDSTFAAKTSFCTFSIENEQGAISQVQIESISVDFNPTEALTGAKMRSISNLNPFKTATGKIHFVMYVVERVIGGNSFQIVKNSKM